MVLRLRVRPNASKTEFGELVGDRLKVAVAGPPVEGKANGTLICFLAKRFRISRSAVEIVSGASSRNKDVLLRGVSPSELVAVLSG